MSLDETDIAILEQLIEDGRSSLRKVANEINVSPSTVSSHMNKMRRKGVIEGFSPDINYSEIDYDLTAIIDVTIESSEMTEAHEDIEDLGNVVSLYEVTGENDLVLICKFRDRRQINSFVKVLLSMEKVEGTKTRVALTAPVENKTPDLDKLIQ